MSSQEEGAGATSVPGGVLPSNRKLPEIAISVEDENFILCNGDLEKLKSLDKAFEGDQLFEPKDKPLIQKVPSTLCIPKDFVKYFKPRVISIGPIHHGDPTLHGSEQLKLILAAHFVKNIGVEKETSSIAYELEQQWIRKNFHGVVRKFIENHVITPAEMKEPQPPSLLEQEEIEAVHLLDRLRKRLILRKDTNKEKNQFVCDWIFGIMKRYCEDEGSTERHYSHTFRNVKELRNAGIWLKPSSSSCLTDVSFSRVCCRGNLWLPPITVDDSTGPKFMNLIAYEMCPDFENDFTVTSYICFLDSLIDEAEDVKELRDAGILYNGLGSDEEVAKLFNKMNTDLVPSPTVYSPVKQQVQNHCRNIWINYAAQAYYTHFNSPWTFLAFVGAIAALLLSALQTYYTIK
ncbi:Lycopene cyclase [Hibiscus syriacus]|uniref:Lycopene cyclase n=1 Tax=Hibiscus syriacus TaxID=106335 RepID=A0A6A2YRF3_HIBSY|nr:Lycopene cyclase [Hibiscus syriacus]